MFLTSEYLHVTFSLTPWLASFPNPLSAVQRYVPVSVLVMIGKSQVAPWCSTSLVLPSSSTLFQVMFGVGSPIASQNKVMFDPSSAVWSRLTLISLIGTENNDTITVTYTSLKLKQVTRLYQVFFAKNSIFEFSRGIGMITKCIGVRDTTLLKNRI